MPDARFLEMPAWPCPVRTQMPHRLPGKGGSTLVLWAILAVLLVAAFAVDGAVLAAVKPLHHSHLSDTINHTIRLLGTGYVQPVVASLMIALGAVVEQPTRNAQASGRCSRSRHPAYASTSSRCSSTGRGPGRPIRRHPRGRVSARQLSFQSFPSAETATTFAVALTIAAWYPTLRVPLIVLSALIRDWQRVIVGSHHPSDVVAGAMLGIAVSQALVRHRASQGGESEWKP